MIFLIREETRPPQQRSVSMNEVFFFIASLFWLLSYFPRLLDFSSSPRFQRPLLVVSIFQ